MPIQVELKLNGKKIYLNQVVTGNWKANGWYKGSWYIYTTSIVVDNGLGYYLVYLA